MVNEWSEVENHKGGMLNATKQRPSTASSVRRNNGHPIATPFLRLTSDRQAHTRKSSDHERKVSLARLAAPPPSTLKGLKAPRPKSGHVSLKDANGYNTAITKVLKAYSTVESLKEIADKLIDLVNQGAILFPIDISSTNLMGGYGCGGKQKGGSGLGGLILTCFGVRSGDNVVLPTTQYNPKKPENKEVLVITPTEITNMEEWKQDMDRLETKVEMYNQVNQLCKELEGILATKIKEGFERLDKTSPESRSNQIDPNARVRDKTLKEFITAAQQLAFLPNTPKDFHAFRVSAYILYVITCFDKIAINLSRVTTLYNPPIPHFWANDKLYHSGIELFISGLNFRFCAAAQDASHDASHDARSVKLNKSTWTSFVLHHPSGLDGPYRQFMSWVELTEQFEMIVNQNDPPPMDVTLSMFIEAKKSRDQTVRYFGNSGIQHFDSKISSVSEMQVIGVFDKRVLYHPDMVSTTVPKAFATNFKGKARSNKIVPVMGLPSEFPPIGTHRGGAHSAQFSHISSRKYSPMLHTDDVKFKELVQMRRSFLVSHYDALHSSDIKPMWSSHLPAEYRELYTQRILFYEGKISKYLKANNKGGFTARTPSDIRRTFNNPLHWTFNDNVKHLWGEHTESYIKSFLIQLHDYRLLWGHNDIKNDSVVKNPTFITNLDTLHEVASTWILKMFAGYDGVDIKNLAMMYRSDDWQRLSILTYNFRECIDIKSMIYTCGDHTLVMKPNDKHTTIEINFSTIKYKVIHQTEMNAILALFFSECVIDMERYTVCTVETAFNTREVSDDRRKAFDNPDFLNMAMYRYFIELHAGGVVRNPEALASLMKKDNEIKT